MITRNRKAIIDTMSVLSEFICSDWKSNTVSSELVKTHKNEMVDLMNEVIELLNHSRSMFPWSNKEVEYLRDMFDQDNTFVEISDELRRSKGAIIGRLMREGFLPDDFLDHNQKMVARKSDVIYEKEDVCI